MTATVTQLFDQQHSLAEVSEVSPPGQSLERDYKSHSL